ncbi:MAG TPA: hypothetical protein PLN18_01730 [Candidatus Colwellbacteria bacterium]|jgi:hypothetical protein|nr:hypothetical protein [Candidatus Colwellbacteria bacterium]HQA96065.1 hypothetical protein [Candidatus Colwellbacteria bacterium]
MAKKEEKTYIVTYRSEEHFEVVGWVWASNLLEAKRKAKAELAEQARRYDVTLAEIAEYKDASEISF